jgi:hypothetical protein
MLADFETRDGWLAHSKHSRKRGLREPVFDSVLDQPICDGSRRGRGFPFRSEGRVLQFFFEYISPIDGTGSHYLIFLPLDTYPADLLPG